MTVGSGLLASRTRQQGHVADHVRRPRQQTVTTKDMWQTMSTDHVRIPRLQGHVADHVKIPRQQIHMA
jgi:hypothetical protein